jgi:hypothetical protein
LGLLSFVSGLSSFATLHSWIIQQAGNWKDYRKEVNIDRIGLEFRETFLSNLNDEFTEEKLDQYISRNASQFSVSSISELFSNDERESVIKDFFLKNPKLQYAEKEKIVSILHEYLDRLNGYINANLTFDTKLIMKTIKDGQKTTDAKLDALKEELSRPNGYADPALSNAIISKCNAINSLMLKHLNFNLWLTDVDGDFITGASMKDIVLRLNMLGSLINLKELNRISGADSDHAIEALFLMVRGLAPDLSVELNEFYNKQILPTLACMKGYLAKDVSYYMSLGALGLFNDNSDESIYGRIMYNLSSFMSLSLGVLDELWKDRDYEKMDREVSDEMHRYLRRHIENLMDKENAKLIQEIYDNKKILDTELAARFSLEVHHLRKRLYKFTEKFLVYNYNDNGSTMLFIDSIYTQTFERYYTDIFAEGHYEG